MYTILSKKIRIHVFCKYSRKLEVKSGGDISDDAFYHTSHNTFAGSFQPYTQIYAHTHFYNFSKYSITQYNRKIKQFVLSENFIYQRYGSDRVWMLTTARLFGRKTENEYY